MYLLRSRVNLSTKSSSDLMKRITITCTLGNGSNLVTYAMNKTVNPFILTFDTLATLPANNAKDALQKFLSRV